jgi:cell division protein FtsQ
MVVVAELLGKARLEAEHLYKTWHVVSLAGLNTDAEVEVRTASGAAVVFSVTADYLSQIAKLDLVLDRLAQQGASFKRITLGGGRDAVVTLDLPLIPAAGPAMSSGVKSPGRAHSPSSAAFGNFPQSPLKSREF